MARGTVPSWYDPAPVIGPQIGPPQASPFRRSNLSISAGRRARGAGRSSRLMSIRERKDLQLRRDEIARLRVRRAARRTTSRSASGARTVSSAGSTEQRHSSPRPGWNRRPLVRAADGQRRAEARGGRAQARRTQPQADHSAPSRRWRGPRARTEPTHPGDHRRHRPQPAPGSPARLRRCSRRYRPAGGIRNGRNGQLHRAPNLVIDRLET